MTVKSGDHVYVVVDVMRGVASDAYCFQQLDNAKACADELRKDRNLDEDDVQVFEKRLDVAEIDC